MNGFITLDYELGMGITTGTPKRCLVEPMDYLASMTERYGIKMNVFVDAAYLLQMNKLKDNFPSLQEDYVIVTNHIKKLDEQGHAIQLHLHPQWCYSTFDGDVWKLDMDHYKLSDIPLDDQKRLLKEGVSILNSLVTRKVTAFRAGGYSVENFPELYDTFLSLGINVDSSVFRGNRSKGRYNTYDYRRVPLKTSWRFLMNHKNEDDRGQMVEYPISTIVVNAVTYLVNKYDTHHEYDNIIESKNKWGDGKPIGAPDRGIKLLIGKLEMLLGKKAIRASIEESFNLEKVYSYSQKNYCGEDFVIIGHPKAISPFNVAVLERFIQNHPEVQFCLF